MEEMILFKKAGQRDSDTLMRTYQSSMRISVLALSVVAAIEIIMLSFTFMNAVFYGEHLWKYRIFYISLFALSFSYIAVSLYMKEYGFSIDTVEEEEFNARMAKAPDAGGALIAYKSREGEDRRYELGCSCDFTTAALYRFIVTAVETVGDLLGYGLGSTPNVLTMLPSWVG